MDNPKYKNAKKLHDAIREAYHGETKPECLDKADVTVEALMSTL